MKRTLVCGLSIIFLFVSVAVANKEDVEERLRECELVMKEILDIEEGIPADLLDKAECIAVLPSVKKFAMGFGGSYGRGALVCRSGDDFAGPWGPPAMIRLEGGSFGLQLGGSATDFVLLIMNQRGVSSILRSNVKLGADASAAAGPKGRSAQAATDAAMNAEILSYSRSKGLFAGVSLEGTTLRQDEDANEDLYGQEISPEQIVLERSVSTPSGASGLVEVLNQASPTNKSD